MACGAAMLFGAGEAQTMSLDDCLAIAAEQNPSLRSASLALDRARALQQTAFDAPATEITLKQTPVDGGGPENGVSFSQEFEFPTRYVARHRMLSAMTEGERLALRRAEADLVRRLTSAYSEAVCRRAKMAAAEVYDSAATRFEAIARARFEAGEVSRLEMLNARHEAMRASVELRRLRDDYAAACRDIDALLGGGNQFGAPADREFVVDAAGLSPEFAATVDGRIAASRISVASRELAYEKQGFLPGITLGATVQALIGSFNPYGIERHRFEKGDFMGFEVGVTVPLFFGAQRARTRAARTSLEMARADYDADRLAADSRRMDLEQQLASRRADLERYGRQTLAEADEMARLARVSYDLGEIGYVEFISNIENAMKLHIERADLLNLFNQTVIELNFLNYQP